MNALQKVTLRRTALRSTRLALSAQGLGNIPNEITDEQAEAIASKAVKIGIGLFETAPFYGDGLAEERLGKVLKSFSREKYILCSQIRAGPSDDDNEMKTKDDVHRSVENTLKNLQTDRLDYLMIDLSQSVEEAQQNSGEPDTPTEHLLTQVLPALSSLKEEGMIRHIGLGSGCDHDKTSFLLRNADFELLSISAMYSLLDQSAAEDVLSLCLMREVDVVVKHAYCGGLLSLDPQVVEKASWAYNAERGIRDSSTDLSLVRQMTGRAISLGVGAKKALETAKQGSASAVSQEALILDKVFRLFELAQNYNVNLKTAAMQFASLHPTAVSIVQSAQSEDEIDNDVACMKEAIPDAFWRRLKEERLIDRASPFVELGRYS